MELADRELTHYAAEPEMKWPSGLVFADMAAPEVHLTAERLQELAESGYAPHWRVDGGAPLFLVAELKRWAARNIVERRDGREIPVQIRLSVGPVPAVDAPVMIAKTPGLFAVPAGLPPGVYFLVKGQDVVYVGQSFNPTARVATHVVDRDKEFDRAYMIPIPKHRINAVEAALIRLLQPRHNVVGNRMSLNPDEDFEVIRDYFPSIDLGQLLRERQGEAARITAYHRG